MSALQVGDFVRTSNNKFTRVFSFGHLDRESEADYLQIYYHSGDDDPPLEISAAHLVFTNGKAVAAEQVRVGDVLDGKEHNQKVAVTSIVTIKRRGLYAPFTESSDLLVSGVLASNYVAILDQKTVPYQHALAHAVVAPTRIVCSITPEFCQSESHENGISSLYWPIVQAADRLGAMNSWIQLVVSVLVLPFLAVFVALEQIVLLLATRSTAVAVLVATTATTIGAYITLFHSRRCRSKTVKTL